MFPQARDAIFFMTFLIKQKSTGIASAILIIPFLILMTKNYKYFFIHLILSVGTSFLLGKLSSLWRYNLLKSHINIYRDNLDFWLKYRNKLFYPQIACKFLYKRIKTTILTGEWIVSLMLIIFSFLATIIPMMIIYGLTEDSYIKAAYTIPFVTFFMITIILLSWFFGYLNWKRNITVRIGQDYGIKHEDIFKWIKETI